MQDNGHFKPTLLLGLLLLTLVACAKAPTRATENLPQARPEVWLATLQIDTLLADREDGTPFNAHWDYVSRNIDGIKFWDFQISSASPEQLRDWFAKMRKLGLRAGMEKGRWPLAPDMHEGAVKRQIKRMREREGQTGSDEELRARAIEHFRKDLGGRLNDDAFTDYEEFVQKAAYPEILRLKKIRDAGGLDLLDFIEYDGAILKNVHAYAFALSQWKMDLPESIRFKPSVADIDTFVDQVYVPMIEIIRQEVPEAAHVKIVHLPNIHLWTYREKVEVETLLNGEKVYHNVDFKRFEDQALDLHDLLVALDRHRDVFTGITTDYPLDFYIRPSGGRRYRGFAREAKARGFHFGACINNMSGEESVEALTRDSLEFAEMLEAHVAPDLYMVQSWFEHPTRQEILVPEDIPGSYLHLVRQIIDLARAGNQE